MLLLHFPFLQEGFSYSWPIAFPHKLSNKLIKFHAYAHAHMYVHKLLEFFHIPLNFQISLGKSGIFSLSFQLTSIVYLHNYLGLSFLKIYSFFVWRSWTSLIIFIPMYLLFVSTIMNDTLNIFCSLLRYSWFCVLTYVHPCCWTCY